MPRVLVVATSRKTRGGITAVIKAHETGEQWKRFNCHWVQTHRDGSILIKLFYLLNGYLDFLLHIWSSDIVHFHVSLQNTIRRKLPLLKFAKLLGKKSIIHLHCGSQIDFIWNKNFDYMFSECDRILVLSESIKKKIASKINDTKRINVLYNPCPQVFLPEIQDKRPFILFSGTLYKGKGYQDLIHAFAEIAYKYPMWKVVFAGNGEIDEGKNLSRKLGIEQQIEFAGWVSGTEKESLFRNASIFCLPSYAEGFPMAVLDAWAYGLPVVTTPVGGIPDVAIDGENMLLFNPGDISQLSNNLERLILDTNLRTKISTASKTFAESIFNINTINHQLSDIYSSVL